MGVEHQCPWDEINVWARRYRRATVSVAVGAGAQLSVKRG